MAKHFLPRFRIAIVGSGPAGLACAQQLARAGHDVTLVSWSHLYPARLYPGEQAVPGGAPDVPPYHASKGAVRLMRFFATPAPASRRLTFAKFARLSSQAMSS